MRNKHFRGMVISLNRTSVRKVALLIIAGMSVLFIIIGMLTSIEQGRRLTSNSIHKWTSEVKGEHFVHILGLENSYFTQALPEGAQSLKLANLAIQLVTSINPDDPRSLLGRELPGFALFDGRIAVAGEGTDYTNLPKESAPPLEVLLEERKATQESLDNLEKLEKDREKLAGTTDGKKVVHIIHSHNYESFLPELETDIAAEAHHKQINITLVGEKLSQELEKRGIGTEVEERDIQAILNEKGWKYNKSYDASRELVKEVMAQKDDLQFFFDIHRDSLPRNKTTTQIEGTDFARIVFVIGGNHANYQENAHLAEQLHNLLQEEYPGLSRGVIIKEGALTNGKFNQDLSKPSILIEIGGVENTLEESYRTAEAFADVFSKFYLEAEAVNSQPKGEK